MTEKEYIMEKFSFLKIGMTATVGTMFALGVYNVQTSGSNFILVLLAIILFGIFLLALGRAYTKLLDEIKAMP